MITDKIDGDIARSRNLITNFGKIADPIADKAITGMAFIGLSIVGRHLVVGDDRGAAPRVERDPAAAVHPQAVVMQAADQRQAQDDRAGASRWASWCCRCRTATRPTAASSTSSAGRRGAVLRRPGLPGGGGRADPVVGLRVLPGRLAAARANISRHTSRLSPWLRNLFRGSGVRVPRITTHAERFHTCHLSSRPRRRGYRTLAAGIGGGARRHLPRRRSPPLPLRRRRSGRDPDPRHQRLPRPADQQRPATQAGAAVLVRRGQAAARRERRTPCSSRPAT